MTIQLKPAPRRFIEDFVAEEITTLTPLDPFGIDDPCPQHPDGHFPIWGDRRTLVCAHCSKVLWS